MARKGSGGDGPIIIKKYANRRLYNTRTSKYITLDFLAELTKNDVEFQVVDARSGEDITHGVLTQIIMEEENAGAGLLPTNFLKQIIALYGDSMQASVPQFLENAITQFRQNQQQFASAFEEVVASGPFAEIAKRNMEMMKAFAPGLTPKADKPAEVDEVTDLKRQMAELQAKIENLRKK